MRALWATEWYSKSLLDGERHHILYNGNGLPALFRTRQKCREHIREKYGYIKERKDLRDEPYGWRLPRAVKVVISVV